MIKVLFLIPDLMHGGAEKVLVNLVNNLDQKKYDITLFSIFDCGINKEYLNPEINYQYQFKRKFRGNSHFFKLFSPRFLYNWFTNDEYDIVISYLEGVAARIISGCPDPTIKKIGWLHTTLSNKSAVKTGFRTIKEARTCYERYDCLVGVSKKIIEEAKINISNKIDYKVLYNTNETGKIAELSRHHLKEKILKNNKIKICSVGKIVSVKGYDRLLKAHKKLLDEGFKHIVYLIGIGEEQGRLERTAKELGVQESFQFIGFHKNPYKYVGRCDLFVCSSRREGFSTAVTEALVLGVPVVSTNCSGAKELLGENNEYGIVTENSTEGIYTGMKEMLSNSEKLNHYKKQAEIRGGFFSKEKTVKAVEGLLDNL